jgi:hypothetical protein
MKCDDPEKKLTSIQDSVLILLGSTKTFLSSFSLAELAGNNIMTKGRLLLTVS